MDRRADAQRYIQTRSGVVLIRLRIPIIQYSFSAVGSSAHDCKLYHRAIKIPKIRRFLYSHGYGKHALFMSFQI